MILKKSSRRTLNFLSCLPSVFMLVLTSCNLTNTELGDNYTPTVQISPDNSTVTTSSSSVLQGNTVSVKLDLRDTSFSPFVVTDAKISFQAVGGTSSGIFDKIVNNKDGTYTANFTAINPGTPTSIHAFINGSELGNTPPRVTVVSGNYSLTTSTLTVSPSTLALGSASTVTLTAKDPSSAQLTSGGLTITFSNAGGTSSGTFGPITDNQDGTYTASFTGTGAGTATSISATIQGNALASTLPTITVIVAPPSSLTYSVNSPVFTKGALITNDVPSHAGGAVVSYSISPALPTGLSFNTSTGVISGTPTAITATGTYTVTATNTSGFTTDALSITVNDVIPSGFSYSTAPAVYTKSSAITANTPTISGGAVVSYSVSPALPAGLTLNTSTGVITGTPTAVTAIATYTITATNTGGSVPLGLSITVNDVAPSSLSYSTPVVYVKGSAITANTQTHSGGTVISYSVSPALPAGLTLNTGTGAISGTPTVVASVATYTVTATNSGGSTPFAISITVNDVAPSSLSYSSPSPTYTKGVAITANTPTNSGGTVVSYSVSPALPAGLSLNTGTGVITGTPTALTSVTTYTVTATNSGGSTPIGVSITVIDVAPTSLSYSTAPAVYTKSSAITANTPSNSGGGIVSYSVSPALPAGLSLNTSTGVITGTPTAITSVATYTITGTNTAGSTPVGLSITVNDVIPSSLTYSTTPAVYTKGSAITANTPSSSGGTVVSYSVSPALPAGLTFNTGTGVITGTPTAITSVATYTVTATNTGGSVPFGLSITINDVIPSSLNYSTAPAIYTKGSAISSNTPTSSGGTVVSYSVSPALPAGLTLNTGTGVITGTPTSVTSVATYTITATNSGGSAPFGLSITVNDIPPSSLTYTVTSATYTVGTLITNNSPSNSGGPVLSYTVSPALPAGLNLSVMTGIISGTPTAVAASGTYTVTATNSGGSTPVTLTIVVNDAPPTSLSYSTSPAVYTINSAITSNTPTHSGGTVVSYSVSPALPTGLNLNTSSGAITGTPTVITAVATYTITATNSGGSTPFGLSITVNDVTPSSLSYSAASPTYTNGFAITSNTPSSSGGAITSYSISPALSAGLNFNTSTGVISGTPTATASSTAYTITATNSGGSTPATVTIIVGAPTITVSSGNNQTASAGTALSAFVALVKDATGTAIASATVDWLVVAGGGSLSSASNSTNGSGLSSSTLTLGSSAGANSASATIHGTSYTLSFSATALAAFANVYRSVGPGNTTALSVGSGSNKLTISGSTATFSAAQPTNIGVGDVIQYDSASNGTIDTVAFISGRTSSTVYTIQTTSGVGTPTAITNDVSWSIFRAYTGLANAFAGTENTGIAAAVRNFDTFTNGTDLTASNQAWNFACYSDGLDTLASLTNTWVTSATNYIKIYTPYLSTEVGISQRHNGVADTSKYGIVGSTSTYPYGALSLDTSVVKVEGLQLQSVSTNGFGYGIAANHTGNATYYFSKNIITAAGSTLGGNGINLSTTSNDQPYTAYIWDNAIFGFTGTGSNCIYDNSYYAGAVSGSTYIYNNTFYHCTNGIQARPTISGSGGRSSVMTLINNIVQGTTTSAYLVSGGSFAAASDYNVSDQASAPGSHSLSSASVGFMSVGGADYRISSTDTVAKGAGTDLSANANLPFSDDIASKTRSTWDIGMSTPITPITFVQQTTMSGGTQGLVYTLSSTPIAGNVLVLLTDTSDTTSITSIAQTNVTWHKAIAAVGASTSEIWYGEVGASPGAAATVTYNATPSAFWRGNLTEWNGLATSNELVTNGTGGNTATSTSPTSTTITPAGGKNAVIFSTFKFGGTFVSGPTNGFTALTTPNAGFGFAYKIVTSTNGSYSTSWTYSASNPWETAIATLSQ